MSQCVSSNRPVPCSDAASVLTGLAEQLLLDEGLPAATIGVSGSANGCVDRLQLAVGLLEHDHPERLLLGFCAPTPWWALGVLTDATVYSRQGSRPSRIAAFAWSGGFLTRLVSMPRGRVNTAPTSADTAVLAGESGWLADLLRLGLGLPTSPEHPAIVDVVTALWLDSAHRAVLGRAAPFCWHDLVAYHPLLDAVGGLETAAAMAPARFGQAISHAATGLGSGGLRRLGTAGDLLASGATVELAEWFDDAAFARWLTQELTAPSDLAAHLCDLVSPRIAAALRTAIRHSTTG